MDDRARQMAIQPASKNRKSKLKRIGVIVGIFAIIGGVGAGVYFWQESNIQSLQKQHEEEIATLNSTIEALKKDISDTAAKEKTTTKDTADAAAAAKAAISSAVSSDTFTALGPLMADSVRVIIAASEGIGNRTPAQAMEDLKYLNSASGTWNFDVPAATIADWRTGDYAAYVPATGGVIGLSSDGYVVIFKLNSENKISDIFMAVNVELM